MLIMLTQGKLMEIDDADFAYMSQWDWYATKDLSKSRPEAQYRAQTWDKSRRKHLYAHRLLAGVTGRNVMVDHMDGNTLNNRRGNLRVCTNAENQYNRKTAWGAVPYKGVVFRKDSKKNKYHARIEVGDERISLGGYPTATEAAKAYNVAALHHFGEFASLNIIPEEAS